MGKRNRFFPSSKISLVHQLSDVRNEYSSFSGRITLSGLKLLGAIQPTPISREYEVQIDVPKTGQPRIEVVSPELQTRDGENIPHRYPDGSLCLYYPPSREWRRELFLSETLIPWAAEWLYFYEVWLVTGTWQGGGIHPARNQRTE